MSTSARARVVVAAFYPFYFYVARRQKDRHQRVFQLRDVAAAVEIGGALQRMGYDYGEALLNYPPEELQEDPPAQLFPVDTTGLGADDVILQVTRPPLDDGNENTKKKVERGHTDLEWIILEAWKQVLGPCSRRAVWLANHLHRDLKPGYENLRTMEFRCEETAPFRRLHGSAQDIVDGGTAAFLLRSNELWPGGPGLISAFGMDGTSSLVWAYHLARNHSDLLRKPGFVIAKLDGPVPGRCTRLGWAKDWAVEIALQVPEQKMKAPAHGLI